MPLTLPTALYVDDAMYEQERRSVFGDEWMILGRTTDLAEAGGYVAEEIAGYPIFVVLDSGGVPWGYHNVCPHRGGPLLFPGRGHTESLVCKYHGWCFSFEGALLDARDFGDETEVQLGEQRLREISMGNWGGLLWVSLAGNVLPLAEELGGLMTDCADIPFDTMVHTEHASRMMNCNWKLVVDNFLETYHVGGNHGILSSHFDMSGTATHVYDDSYVVQRAETTDGVPMRWFYRYPNVMLQVLGSTVCWMQVLPQGPHKTLLVLDYFAPPGADDGPLKTLCTSLQDEDQRICEMVHKNLRAGVYGRGQLSPKHETALVWFHSKIMTALDVRAE